MAADGRADRRPDRFADVRHRPVLGLLAAVATIAVLVAVGGTLAPRLPDAVGHGLSHALVGLPLAVLLFAALRWWPPCRPTRPARSGRRFVVAGLSAVVLGQLLEVLGARVDEPGATGLEELAHTAGQIVTMLGMPVAALGGILAGIAAARDGAVPRWGVALAALLAGGLLTMMMVGAPGS